MNSDLIVLIEVTLLTGYESELQLHTKVAHVLQLCFGL